MVEIDTVGPLKLFENNRYILTIQNLLTRYIVELPMPNKVARTIAETLGIQFILKCALLKVFKSDSVTEFQNPLNNNTCDFKKRITTLCYHGSLGSCERSHRVFN